ncbi:C13 family peptidase [Sphingomonas sp. H39-1-10]|uniref:C13 family peptidase n=1 Tax=Sphingomonas TaxID=13687 RepID=UPI0008813832|nr:MULTISPECIES: C13 family peptidase [Sphingomonas]MDF0486936.1 C13 family peptidase [Sphingomonas pollutisoli]SDA27402.1 Peptidase C13 family protein [Sphingomonas sp. NFR15]
MPLRPFRALLLSALLLSVAASAQPPRPAKPRPPAAAQEEDDAFADYAAEGFQLEHGREPGWQLAEHRRLDRALTALQPQRTGVVDAYVLVAGLDSDPVFGREAREAARVLARRYDAAGRTIVLAGPDGRGADTLARGSPDNIAAALAHIAETIDKSEDVLVLYTTSHGAPYGIVYQDGDAGVGAVAPARLAAMLATLGLKRRLVIVSACYSGVFVPALATADGVVMTAASADRSSFGCEADSDWTFFGDALINHALRKNQPFAAAAKDATTLIARWEAQGKLRASNPRLAIGARAPRWLGPLERRLPRPASAPVGRPATSLFARKPA